MATRTNLCPNPCLTNNITGWGGGGTPTRTDVTGLGFARQFAARYSAGSFVTSPIGAATAGLTYTVSVFIRPQTFPINGTVWCEFQNGGGGNLASFNQAFTAPLGAVTRISMSGTAPASTATTWLVISGEDFSSNATDITQCLIEQAGALDTYFDGDTVPGGSWTGTAGNSPSTLVDATPSPPPRSPNAGARRCLLVR